MENYKCGHKVNFLSAENDDMTHRYHQWRIHFGLQKGLCGLYRMPTVAPCEQWLGLWLVAVYIRDEILASDKKLYQGF